MYLENWMLIVMFILWMISLFDLWRTGVYRGIDATISTLEENSMILVDYDEEGNRTILKVKRLNKELDNDERPN